MDGPDRDRGGQGIYSAEESLEELPSSMPTEYQSGRRDGMPEST